MSRICIIVPEQELESEQLASKLQAFCSGLHLRFEILVSAQTPSLQRYYLFDDPKLVEAANLYCDSVRAKAKKSFARLTQKNPSLKLSYVWKKSELNEHLQQLKDTEYLGVYCHKGTPPALYVSLVEQSQRPVFVIRSKAKAEPLHVLAAIDPFHEDDAEAKLDVRVVKTSKQLCQASDSRLQLAHSCYVPTFLMRYSSSIYNTHEQGVKRFLRDNGWSKFECRLLNGKPSEAIRALVKKHDFAIVVMGLSARGLFKKRALGSTVVPLLESSDCDLLLVP
ncbi:universal stress protein [Paraferrimonas sedimenticola]|uniref:UspA domain-containing protein n=1 Tax=Paraferrimonas sedimenticola TaxID=375674 RepID=A0AA37RWL4_9GAMM|nr:universal stress protein [Paraferrimonas sedimenticola]GLP96314.1 hypothetical protein GCM10007895_16200 [Paraferrimonas sedimenticola]